MMSYTCVKQSRRHGESAVTIEAGFCPCKMGESQERGFWLGTCEGLRVR